MVLAVAEEVALAGVVALKTPASPLVGDGETDEAAVEVDVALKGTAETAAGKLFISSQ